MRINRNYFNPLIRPSNQGERFFKYLLIWNPLISVFFNVIWGNLDHFWINAFISYFISTVIVVGAFTFTIVARIILNRLPISEERRKALIERRTFWLYLSGLSMPFGLYAASYLLLIFFHHGILANFVIDSQYYRTGMIWGGGMMLFLSFMDLRRVDREAKQKTELRIKALENENLRSELSALTAQMNPHLLFNSLNTIASMIPSDPASAEETTVRLAELYRGFLNSTKQTTHSLRSELEICSTYLSLEKARFGSRLRVQTQVDPALDLEQIQVPILILQPLIENAIKHGISPKSLGGEVRINVETNGDHYVIRVEDDGVGLGNSPSKSGSGTAVRNCQQRIELTYGEAGKFVLSPLTQGGTSALIQIPLRVRESAL